MQTNRFAMSVLAGVLSCGLGSAVPAAAQQPGSPTRPASDTQQERDAKRTTEKSGNAVKDSWITMKIHSQFVPEDALEDSDIDVDTNGGVVTLTGTVASAQGKTRAVEIAKATDGVMSVRDQLRIGPADVDDDADERAGAAATATGSDAREKGREMGRETRDATAGTTKAVTDGWIKSKIYAQYVNENALEDSDINLDVNRGVVTLKGTVASAESKTRAEQIAKTTDGVKSVKNSLRVSPQS